MDDRVAISLYRHGMTHENEQNAYIGWTNSPLSKAGTGAVRQAALSRSQADIVFSSPLLRCLQTANIWYPDHEIVQVLQFKEMHFGSYEGKTYDELKMLPHYQTWIENPFSERPHGGESFEQFSRRVEQGWHDVCEHIMNMQASSITIITHGGVIRHLLSKLASERQSFFSWEVPCAGGYQLTWSRDSFNEHKRCQRLQKI